MNIRFATEQDVPQILIFISHLAEFEKLSHEAVATEQQLLDTLFCDKPYAEVLIAETDDNEPAGFALFFHNYSTFLGQAGIHLEDLYVLEKFQGLGIGKALLKKLAAITVERKCGRLEWAVLDWNTPAIEFYKSQGAIQMEGWTTNRVTAEALLELAAD